MKAEADRADQVGVADTGRNSVAATACAEADVATRPWTTAEVATTSLMEAVVERGNLMLAYQRVVENKGHASASHMRAAYPKSWFDTLGLVSLLDTVQRLQCVS
jgi:hypothetical protein